SLSPRLAIPGGDKVLLSEVLFFSRRPMLALAGSTFYVLRNAPPVELLEQFGEKPAVPVRKLSHRLLGHLRKSDTSQGINWEQLCVAHQALPQFVFELLDETVRLRLLARSQRDQSIWFWNGHEWHRQEPRHKLTATDKPEVLDDGRLDPATQWL